MVNSKLKVVLVSAQGTETEITQGTTEVETKQLIQHLADNCCPLSLLHELKKAYKFNAYERKLEGNIEYKKRHHEKDFKDFLTLLKELD